MLNADVINVYSKEEFDQNVKALFVNMQNNVRTLHKTGGCYYATYANQFIPFSSLEEVMQYESKHHDATPFKRCGNCFKKR